MSNNNGKNAGQERIFILLDIVPPTAWGKNSKSSFKGRVVTNPRVASTKEILTGLLKPYVPEKPMEGPLMLDVQVRWPVPATLRNRCSKRGISEYPKTTRPDGDNVLATIKDLLQTLRFFHDDAQIFDERIVRYCGEPCIEIDLRISREVTP